MASKFIDNYLGLHDLFKDEILASTLFHIPHSSTTIPSTQGMNMDLVGKEIELLTDWATERIFNVPFSPKVVANFSRIFCDVERLPDDQEEMFEKGRGYFYTHSDEGLVLRENDLLWKEFVYQNYYRPHHVLLENWCEHLLEKYNTCTIIDCHSFSEEPLKTEMNQNKNRPDICLGTDNFHTPDDLIKTLKKHFENAGLSVEINKPYAGTIVPAKYYKNEKRLSSIMIEINKGLYMDGDHILEQKVCKLNEIIKTFFEHK